MRSVTAVRALVAAVAILAPATAFAGAAYEAVGGASWYGNQFHGRRTASGERYDMNQITAAHPSLPIGSIVEVTNLDNDRTVQVRVNDRGPFGSNRIIDLSRAAADRLGFLARGTAQVRIRVLDSAASLPAMLTAKAEAPKSPKRAKSVPAPDIALAEATATEPTFAIQAGAFGDPDNARRTAEALAAIGPVSVKTLVVHGATLHRVLVGAWSGKDEAQAALASVATAGFADARVVKRS